MLMTHSSLLNTENLPLRTPAFSTQLSPSTAIPANRSYVIVLATGLEDHGKRATLAFSAACSALAIDRPTYVFLVGDGSHWAYEGHADAIHQAGFPALNELIDTYLELDGKLYICSACDQVCSLPLTDGAVLVRRQGIEVRGLVSILDYAAHSSTITF
ncbi:MAG: hypothetical protein E6Q83_05220 [Thiothrix sp.]|nr:MAG: hypothetical protein E6Q83_05220 [Thiothrix sp.]